MIWFIAIGVAFFFIVDPFRLFTSSNIPRMRASSEVREQMRAYLAESTSATRFVVDLLGDHDLVLVGETGYVKQQLEFVSELIPELAAAGIRHLGFQYANHADQERIDALVSGEEFDEALARQILFNHMVILGYYEHLAVFRAAWQVNRVLAPGEQPFRIIGLSVRPNYEPVVRQEDTNDPAILKVVFAGGVPDQVMASVIRRELLDPGHRAVVYTQLQHAFTGFDQAQYRQTMAERGFPDSDRMGNLLRREYGNRVVSAIFHSPLQDSRSRTGHGYPVGGLLDDIIKDLPEDRRSHGFLTAPSPFADAPITSEALTKDREETLTLSVFADGYLVVDRLNRYVPVTAIPGFITEENAAEARRAFPGPDPGEVSVEDMNGFIEGNVSTMTRIFQEFK